MSGLNVGGAAERPAPKTCELCGEPWPAQGFHACRAWDTPSGDVVAERPAEPKCKHCGDSGRIVLEGALSEMGAPCTCPAGDPKPTRNRAGIIAGLEQLASEDPYNGLMGDTCRQAAALLRAAAQVGEPREPPAPSREAVYAAFACFGPVVKWGDLKAALRAAYAVDFPVRAGAPPTETWINVERLWCKALLPEGPDVIQRVTTRAIELRRALSGGGPPPMSEGTVSEVWTEHLFHVDYDPLLKWIASCSCGKWAPPSGWASQRQAKKAWRYHASDGPTGEAR